MGTDRTGCHEWPFRPFPSAVTFRTCDSGVIIRGVLLSFVLLLLLLWRGQSMRQSCSTVQGVGSTWPVCACCNRNRSVLSLFSWLFAADVMVDDYRIRVMGEWMFGPIIIQIHIQIIFVWCHGCRIRKSSINRVKVSILSLCYVSHLDRTKSLPVLLFQFGFIVRNRCVYCSNIFRLTRSPFFIILTRRWMASHFFSHHDHTNDSVDCEASFSEWHKQAWIWRIDS